MSTPRRKPRTGLLLLAVAFGTGAVGYFLGGMLEGGPEGGRTPSRTAVRPAGLVEAETTADVDTDPGLEDVPEGLDTAAIGSGEELAPADLIDRLRREAGTERGQLMVIGLVADAARQGSAALPRIRELLASGADLRLAGYKGGEMGYPTLRVALLAAAEATGDPEAARMIAEVASTSESPVEIVFGAHLLDRLDALDPAMAQRTLDALQKPLTPEQRKAMGPVVGKVVPAAAAADPLYAEQFLTTQLRAERGKGADPRHATAVLEGLPRERAHELVIATMTAADVSERNKRTVAARAAQRDDPALLTQLRQSIESRAVDPRVAASVANAAAGGRAWAVLERSMYREIKSGNLEEARRIASRYQARLAETRRTADAAVAIGARLRNDFAAQLQVRNKRLDMARARLSRALKKRAKSEKKS